MRNITEEVNTMNTTHVQPAKNYNKLFYHISVGKTSLFL